MYVLTSIYSSIKSNRYLLFLCVVLLMFLIAETALFADFARADWDPSNVEYWPDYAYAKNDQITNSIIGNIFSYLSNEVAPIVFGATGIATIIAIVAEKYRHALGLFLITLVVICFKYVTPFFSLTGASTFLFVCLTLVGLLKFFWNSDKPTKNVDQTNSNKKDRVGSELKYDSVSRQSVGMAPALAPAPAKGNLSKSAFTGGFTGRQ